MKGCSGQTVWSCLVLVVGLGWGQVATGVQPARETGPDPAQQRPNIVLIVTDDLSCTLGCYGDPVAVTPAIDSLAHEGVLYRNAFATTASCSPSRSVILSGLYSHATGQYGLAHSYHNFGSRAQLATLAPMLTQAGYRTARIGKFHVQPEATYEFAEAIKASSRNPVAMAKACRKLIQEESRSPFFLYFCTSDPHRGGGGVADDPLQPDRFGNRPVDDPHPGVDPLEFAPQSIAVPDWMPQSNAARAELAQYYQSVNRIDQGVARLLQELREAGKLDSTVILFTSDHGMAFVGAKTTVYEPGLRIPFIVRDPRQEKRNFACDAMISLVDVTPTILDIAGADTTQIEFHGKSLVSTLDKEHPAGFDVVFASHTLHEVTMYYPMRAVRNRRYKLIWNIAHPLPFPFARDLWRSATWQMARETGNYGQRTVQQFVQRPEFELYDLVADPLETNNLATEDERAELLEEMLQQLRGFQAKTGDPWKLKWEHE